MTLDRENTDRPPLRLAVLIDGPLSLQAGTLARALAGLHVGLAGVEVEIDAASRARGLPFGAVAWGPHVVRLAAFPMPLPADRLELCVRPSHLPRPVKESSRRHTAHAFLTYAGREADPLEQYATLALVGGALATQGARFLVNEESYGLCPSDALWGSLTAEAAEGGDVFAMLRAMPIPLFYGGFLKIEIEGEPGVWMRTVGNDRLGLPDLALHADTHGQRAATVDLFTHLLGDLRATGGRFEPGQTVPIGPGRSLRWREPTAEEYFLESRGVMLVGEWVGSDEAKPSTH
jgi:hypothetical protein